MGNLEVVRFLSTSEELKTAEHTWVNIHAQKDEGFIRACQEGHVEAVGCSSISSGGMWRIGWRPGGMGF